MARYIDVEELLEELRIAAEKEGVKANEMAKAGVYDASVKYNHGEYCYFVAQEIVKDIPTADVVEVKHGEWVSKWSNISNSLHEYCSSCGALEPHVLATNKEHSNYCPNCGAKMDGGKTDDKIY